MSPLDELRDDIRNAKRKAAPPSQQLFVPAGELARILPDERIHRALDDPAFGLALINRESAANTVIHGGRAIFALLVDLSLCHLLQTFLEHDISDKALPVDQTRLETLFRTSAQALQHSQWCFIPHTFKSNGFHMQLDANVILPYTSTTRIGGGNCSTVYEIKIHPSHNHLVPSDVAKTTSFVCKQLETSVSDKRMSESQLLHYLRALKHENIVQLLASYTQNEIPCLIFHRADCDLKEFLRTRKVNRPAGFEEDYLVVAALHGLSSGLRHLHKYRYVRPNSSASDGISLNGCHYDLKPQNVLVRGGTFVLADFGLSRLKDAGESSNTPWQNTTFDYAAPESRHPETFQVGRVGRASDVWSLACIIMETLVYLRAGPDGVTRFRETRKFCGQSATTWAFHNDGEPSEGVGVQLKQLRSSVIPGMPALSFLLQQMLEIGPDERPTIDVVEAHLQRAAMQAVLNRLYEVLDQIKARIPKEGSHSVNTTSALLHLDSHRLRSWANAIGLPPEIPVHQEGSNLAQFPPLRSFQEVWHIVKENTSGLDLQLSTEHHPDRYSIIVSQLYQLNNRLYGTLDEPERLSADRSFTSLGSLASSSDDLFNICSMPNDDNPYLDVALVATSRYMAILESESISSADDSARKLRIDSALISRDEQKDDLVTRPQTYWYHESYDTKRKVHVERIEYGKSWYKEPERADFREIGEKVFNRVQKLAALLQQIERVEEFRSLRCLGAFHSTSTKDKYLGLVFEVPDQHEHLVRLQRLLTRESSSTPDLDDIYRLADALASSVHCVHAAGWLHKDINPLNIVFSHHSQTSWHDIQYASPRLIGFDHSRQDLIDEFSEGPSDSMRTEYQHPAYRKGGVRYKKSHDIYSLGLVLLNIGLWRTLENTKRAKKWSLEDSPETLTERYIELCDRSVKKAMGRKFSDAVKHCLRPSLDNNGEDDVSQAFKREVVDPLARLKLEFNS
ncbi:protein kinase-like domain-containing protein [Xylariomycetidae sp. FL0641]|nr:protein kinase-like domain-containing protein [Xylariomycetidae sp. FL0641]